MPVKLSSSGSDHESEEARIEIVPLIDIMFFLLASFMLVSLSMSHIQRVPIKLPASSSGISQKKAPPVHIAVDAHGVITWNKEIVTPTEITERLREMPDAATAGVMIGADESSSHKQFMAVVDAVRAAKIDKIGIETKPAQP